MRSARVKPDEPTSARVAGAADVLIDADELSARLQTANAPVVLDVRWRLGDQEGRRHYLEGHIPTAVYVDLETELSDPPSPAAGRHPLPSLAALQAAARRWGIGDGSTIVAYDDVGNLSAARAWWLLRWGGLGDVYLLDGGLRAWRRAGHALETGVLEPPAGNIVLSAGHLPVLEADDAARLAREGVLLDARAAERYRGDVEPIDPRAGHIPGALSAPTADNLRADETFATATALATRFRALRIDGSNPVGVYCGSGVTAAHEVAALAIAGIDAALYAGSWSQWCADPARPIATGG
jgi:thiosulfate/3-mercaptopyruvate sulfurtransferase